MSEKALKGRFLKLQNHSNKGKGKEKRKSEEKERRRTEKKSKVADSGLVSIIATLEIDLRRKNCGTQTEGPFGDYVFKSPASLYL